MGVVPGPETPAQFVERRQRIRSALLTDDGTGWSPLPVFSPEKVDEVDSQRLLGLPLAALAFRAKSRPVPKALYDALTKALESEVEALAALGLPVTVFVPPLTAKVLGRGARGEGLLSAVVDLREEFTGLRSAYSEFRRGLEDPSRTLRDQLSAKKRMYDQVLGLFDGDSGHALNVRTVWDKLVSASLDEAGSSSKLSLSGAVSLLLDQLSQKQIRGRARALFDLWADTTNIENYGGLLESSLGVRVDTEEAKFVRSYSEAERRIIRT
jgi:hypothetical protein